VVDVGGKFAGKRPLPFHIIMPTQTAVLTQPLVIPQNLNQPAAFAFYHLHFARRPFPTQTTRHFQKPQPPTHAKTAKTCAKTRSLCGELAQTQRSAKWAEFAQV
jgi:hypothetical protein